MLGIGQHQLHHHEGSAGLYRMLSQRSAGRAPCVLILRSSASAMFTQTLALGADTMVQAQQNTLHYTQRITVNVIEVYYILHITRTLQSNNMRWSKMYNKVTFV